MRRVAASVFAVAIVLVLVAASGTASPATGGSANGVATVSFSPPNATVGPGEEFAVGVTIDSRPTLASGLYAVTLTVAFDPAYVRARNVTPGGYMSSERETTVRTIARAIDNGEGTVTFGLERDPARGGVDGAGRFADIAFVVRGDAPAGRFDLALRDSELALTDESLQRVITEPATVTVAPKAKTTAPGTTTTTADDPAPTTATDGGGFGDRWLLAALGLAIAIVIGAWVLRRI